MFKKVLIATALALPLAFGVSVAQAQLPAGPPPAGAQLPVKKPNILVIMGDDVGWFNVGAYHQGIMSGKSPNLDGRARNEVH